MIIWQNALICFCPDIREVHLCQRGTANAILQDNCNRSCQTICISRPVTRLFLLIGTRLTTCFWGRHNSSNGTNGTVTLLLQILIIYLNRNKVGFPKWSWPSQSDVAVQSYGRFCSQLFSLHDYHYSTLLYVWYWDLTADPSTHRAHLFLKKLLSFNLLWNVCLRTTLGDKTLVKILKLPTRSLCQALQQSRTNLFFCLCTNIKKTGSF